jgi:hypothetical protein
VFATLTKKTLRTIMAIKGLTDKSDRNDRSILGRIEIKVFKGDRMTGSKGQSNTRAGVTLQKDYRITTANTRLRKLLEAAYGKANEQGDILTDVLNVYFPFEESDRTFATSMKSFSASGLEIVCDRETISKEVQQMKDDKGNIHRPIIECSKPCFVAGQPVSVQCPKGCKAGGEFYFYIRELFDADIMTPCLMTVHGYSDIDYIGNRLETLQAEIGSITNSPFPSFQTRHKIPFTLTRAKIGIKRPVVSGRDDGYKRTGKKADGETWAVEINPDTRYMELLRAWRLADELKRMNIALPSKALAGLLQGDAAAIQYIDVDVVESVAVKALPVAIQERQITSEEWAIAKHLFEENNWTKNATIRLLQECFAVEKASLLTIEQLRRLEAIAVDPDEREYWQT